MVLHSIKPVLTDIKTCAMVAIAQATTVSASADPRCGLRWVTAGVGTGAVASHKVRVKCLIADLRVFPSEGNK
jgi:hypothetical protein